MELKQIVIKDFKSIKNLVFPVKGNILSMVGKNECGKSSILEAISYLNPRKTYDDLELTNKTSKIYEKGYPYLAGLFEMSQAHLNKLKDFGKAFFTDDFLQELGKLKSVNAENLFFEIERWGNGVENLSMNLIEKDKKLALRLFDGVTKKSLKTEFAENLLTEIFPNIALFRDEEIKIKPATINQLNSDDPTYDTLRKLLLIIGCEDFGDFRKSNVHAKCDTFSDAITELFRKYYLQDDSISLKISYQAGKVDLLIKDETKQYFSITQRSPGFQYFFAFIINKHFSTLNSSKNQIFLLDEPGSNLHPKGSRDLLKTFVDISNRNSQIIYTTHNTFLAFRDDIDMLYHIRKKIKVGTYIDKKPYRDNYQELRRELGIILSDSMLIGELNLIVEGATELMALPQLLRSTKFCQSENINLEFINVFNAEGAPEIKSAIRYIDSLELSGVVLFDSDEAGQKILTNTKISTILKKRKWEYFSISDVFGDKELRTFEDLFPQKEYVESYNLFNKSNSDVIDFANDFIPFELTKGLKTPIADELKSHYQNFLSEERKKKKEGFNKVGVMRILLQKALAKSHEDIKKDYLSLLKFIELLVEKIEKVNKWLK